MMPPKRDPRRDQAAELYKQHNGQIDLAVIAEQLGISAGTVRGWKSKDKTAWSIGTERGLERSEKRSERSKPILPSTPKASSVDKLIADAVEENEELTEQQKDFCTYYSRIRNATQAYFKAYGCAYSTAHTNGPALLANTRIKEELRRLREIKTAALGELCGDDVVELHMRIAFADINDFVEFKSYIRPVMRKGAPVMFENPESGKIEELTQTVNVVKLRNSEVVDGQLITEVSEGRDGVKIKRADQQRSLAFLERYFELNPMDRHRKEYDNKRLVFEDRKIDLLKGENNSTSEPIKIILERSRCQKSE